MSECYWELASSGKCPQCHGIVVRELIDEGGF
jgi:hypothetical protein